MRDRLRLGVLATHPIQYHAPLFRALVREDVDLSVFFAHKPTAAEQGAGFNVPFEWDVDLLGGYPHEFLRNHAQRPSTTGFFGCNVPDIRDAVAKGGYHAFLVAGWHSWAYLQAIRACREHGIPVLVRGDSQIVRDAPRLKRAVKKVAHPLLVRQFAVCLSVGSRSEEYFRHYGARNIVRSPHFVDNEFYARGATPAAREEGRRRWALPSRKTVFLFAGKFSPVKRPLDFIRALAELPPDDVAGLLVGDGEMKAQCETEARRLGVDVRFVGFLNQSEMPTAYAAADLLVLPSALETWGLVVNEAMASGLPVAVSQRVGCVPDLVREGVTGWSFEAGDTAQLARLLRLAAADPVHLRGVGESARRAVAPFSAQAAAAGVIRGALLARARAA